MKIIWAIGFGFFFPAMAVGQGIGPSGDQYASLLCYGRGHASGAQVLSLFDISAAERGDIPNCRAAISCAHAVHALIHFGNVRRDGDGDGVPCEAQICKKPKAFTAPVEDPEAMNSWCQTWVRQTFASDTRSP